MHERKVDSIHAPMFGITVRAFLAPSYNLLSAVYGSSNALIMSERFLAARDADNEPGTRPTCATGLKLMQWGQEEWPACLTGNHVSASTYK